MMKQIDIKDVVKEVRRLAEEQPDHVYSAPEGEEICSYVTGKDGKGCIVGQALSRLGVPESALRGIEGEGAYALPELIPYLAGREDKRSRRWLTLIQSRQDGGRTWWQAVTEADQDWPLP